MQRSCFAAFCSSKLAISPEVAFLCPGLFFEYFVDAAASLHVQANRLVFEKHSILKAKPRCP